MSLDDDVREAEESAHALLSGLADGPTGTFADVTMLAYAYHAAVNAVLHNSEYSDADRLRTIDAIAAIEPHARACAEKWLKECGRWRADDT